MHIHGIVSTEVPHQKKGAEVHVDAFEREGYYRDQEASTASSDRDAHAVRPYGLSMCI